MDEFLQSTKGKCLVVLLAVGLLSFFIIKVFVLGSFGKESSKLSSELKDVQLQTDLVEEIMLLEKKSAGNADTALIKGSEDVIAHINRIAEENSIQIKSIAPSKPIEKGNLVVFPIQIHGQSSYHQIGYFISQLEREIPASQVMSLAMTPDSVKQDIGGVNYSMSFQAFKWVNNREI